ncbi:Fic family protein [Streptomyces scabiei]|uniref:Fic family protein n=1 Tax=Streptomyces TaxID=1883 RepID=UPI0009975EFE|nr:Fic family protein [Streptomyces scabiei]MDX2574899.1 Fic family protein [Streptomyces scabiei]MDX2650819.1 Fic family protein [Streptomyces scabiei]MDX2719839.1 Fic family protein [Streptomyces scabiei]MDX2868853.1 Fic family protein [Streptomyces scabiei]MDX2886027.1 Fic family protein [Streptomyces scabiei]
MRHVEEEFAGTPYLIASDTYSLTRFSTVQEKAVRSREKSIAVQSRIATEGQELFEPYQRAIRSRLVAESNRIEGYEWSHSQVTEVALMYKELLQAPIGSLMQAVRQDPRVYQALGLYKAHEVADEWARASARPHEYEIRSLHALIASGEPYAGKYKAQGNEIGGTSLRTAAPWDVGLKMRELSDWWQDCSVNPALEATIIHAWLTHIHPFEDGNGRMARILANLALARNGFPPLLVQSRVDRGQYYDVLAESDEGDLLPLYDLFVSVLNRTVRIMSKPDYVRDIIKDRLLTTSQNRYGLWKALPERYFGALSSELKGRGWSLLLQGYPDLESFALLEEKDSEGNSWFAKVLDRDRAPRWLLWYGFTSQRMQDLSGDDLRYPSIFTSIRDDDPTSIHPYRPFQAGGTFPDEIVLRPMEKRPVLFRSGYEVDELDLSTAARYMADALTV